MWCYLAIHRGKAQIFFSSNFVSPLGTKLARQLGLGSQQAAPAQLQGSKLPTTANIAAAAAAAAATGAAAEAPNTASSKPSALCTPEQ